MSILKRLPHANVKRLEFGRGIINELGSQSGQYVVATMPIQWSLVKTSIGTQPLQVIEVLDMDLARTIAIEKEVPRCDTVVAIGGGQAMDLGKYIAWKRGCRLVNVPTIVSTNAYVTQAVGVRNAGKVEYIGIRTIVECYLEINDICIPLGHYRVEEGPEHFFAYNIEFLTRRTFVHGWLVGLGIQLMSQLQENDPAGIVKIMERLGLPHSPRANELTRLEVKHALESLRLRTIADDRWYGIIHQSDITTDFIERITSSLDYV